MEPNAMEYQPRRRNRENRNPPKATVVFEEGTKGPCQSARMRVRAASRSHSSLSSSSLSTRAMTKKVEVERRSRAVARGRLLFLLSLLFVAALLSSISYYILRASENEVAQNQFDAVVERALLSALAILNRKRLGTITMSDIASNYNPEVEPWPFVAVDGYEEMASDLIDTSSGRGMAFVPLVAPDHLEAFEEYAYQYMYEERDEPFPNTTAVSSFGRGIWNNDPEGRTKATDGSASFDSPNKVLAPMFQHNKGAHRLLMMNLHYEETRGSAIDEVISCSEVRKNDTETVCGTITNVLFLQGETAPGALLIQPVYPRRNKTALTGIIVSSVVWTDLFLNIFNQDVNGIECVLRTETQSFTYQVNKGVAELLGEGEVVGQCRSGFNKTIALTTQDNFSENSPQYELYICPTNAFFGSYRTSNPALSAFGAAFCIFITSLLFILYDFYVRKDYNSKIQLLEAKRKFVRFISHEVRTPLNSVCMGLSVIQQEIGSALGRESEYGKLKVKHAVDEKNAEQWLSLSQEILINAQSSVDVLNDLLNYDKIEMGQLSLEYTIVDPWKLVESVVTEFKLPCAAKSIDLTLNFSADDDLADTDLEQGKEPIGSMSEALSKDFKDTKVVGDVIRITQVLRNLISNAVKFTKDEGKLSVSAKWIRMAAGVETKMVPFILNDNKEVSVREAGMVKLSVTDTGAGLSKLQLAKLFGDGVQFNVNELQSGQGSGLGLYIAKGIVEQHGGSLGASSKGLGYGTTFTMSVPLFHSPSDLTRKSYDGDSKNEENHNTASSQSEHDRVTSLNVLVVDDAPMNRKLLRRMLENHGHSVSDAEDGNEAVEMMGDAAAAGTPFDSILLDYEMPRMNGPTACRIMRQKGCDAFIIGVTGNLLPEDVAYFKDHGTNAVLPKPLRFSNLDDLWQEYGLFAVNYGTARSSTAHSTASTEETQGS